MAGNAIKQEPNVEEQEQNSAKVQVEQQDDNLEYYKMLYVQALAGLKRKMSDQDMMR